EDGIRDRNVTGVQTCALPILAIGGALIPPIRKPSSLLSPRYWRDVVRGAGLIYGFRDGVYGSTLGHIFDYLRPDFHPNDHDTSAQLEYFKKVLLDPEEGLLTPYLTREFYPGGNVKTA